MMMAALVCFFGKKTTLSNLFLFTTFLLSWYHSLSHAVLGPFSSFNRLQLVLLLVLLFTANI